MPQTRAYKSLFQPLLSVPLDVYPKVGLLDRMIILSLIFRGTAIPFFSSAAPLYVPTNREQGLHRLHILTDTGFILFVDRSHSNGCEVADHNLFNSTDRTNSGVCISRLLTTPHVASYIVFVLYVYLQNYILKKKKKTLWGRNCCYHY